MTENLQDIFKISYWVALALLVVSLFGFLPKWLPLSVFATAFIIHWQYRIKLLSIKRANESTLLARYAPELSGDFVTDGASVLKRIAVFRAEYPQFSSALTERLRNLQEHYKTISPDAMPICLTYAMLQDFELVGKYFKAGNSENTARAIVLLNRTTNIEHWMAVTGTDLTLFELSKVEADKVRGNAL